MDQPLTADDLVGIIFSFIVLYGCLTMPKDETPGKDNENEHNSST